MDLRQSVVLTVANQKGGVGKTTTVMNVGAALAELGNRVLLIDGDPQANLTSYLGVTPGEGQYEKLRTLDEVYLAKRALDPECLAEFTAKSESGVDLIASDLALSGVEYYLFSKPDKELVLRQFISGIRRHYDFILIDTPPSLNLLSINALCASDFVLIPVQPEFFSVEGIVKIRESIESIRERWNKQLKIIGVLPTQVTKRRKLTNEVMNMLKGELGDVMFDTVIRDNAAVTESSGHAKSVIQYQRSSHGAKDYVGATRELSLKIKKLLEADA